MFLVPVKLETSKFSPYFFFYGKFSPYLILIAFLVPKKNIYM